jgi:hypothetical protein
MFSTSASSTLSVDFEITGETGGVLWELIDGREKGTVKDVRRFTGSPAPFEGVPRPGRGKPTLSRDGLTGFEEIS